MLTFTPRITQWQVSKADMLTVTPRVTQWQVRKADMLTVTPRVTQWQVRKADMLTVTPRVTQWQVGKADMLTVTPRVTQWQVGKADMLTVTPRVTQKQQWQSFSARRPLFYIVPPADNRVSWLNVKHQYLTNLLCSVQAPTPAVRDCPSRPWEMESVMRAWSSWLVAGARHIGHTAGQAGRSK